MVGGRPESDHARFPGAQMLDDALDRAILARRVAPFDDNQKFAAVFDNLALQRTEANLECVKLLIIAGYAPLFFLLIVCCFLGLSAGLDIGVQVYPPQVVANRSLTPG